jgi:hypothetical protein
MPVAILPHHARPAIRQKGVSMIRYVMVLVLSVFALGALAQDSPPGGGQLGAYQAVENKAALVKADDTNSVRALADELFNFPRAFPRMPALMESMAKDRLIQAEMLYRQGKKPGVQERDVADTLNGMADKLGCPPHSKTTLSQIRLLRMSLALAEPTFMGTGLTQQGIALGESVDPSMSPLQAAHIIQTVIDQKLINPLFQVSAQEWENVNRQKFMEDVQASQSVAARARGTGATATASVRSHSPEKRRELEESLRASISALSETDGLKIIAEAFTKLGIE